MIAIGESELNIVPIVDALLNNKSLFNIKGIAYRDAEKVFKTQEIELLDDLDKIPLLDYNLVNLDIDLDSDKLITFPIEVGRSCPFSCTFCCTKTFWKQKFRMKSTARLIDEIEYIMGKYEVTNFHFLHDLFTFKKDLVMDFCSEIKRRNIQIRWICSARVDTINEDMIQAMYEAGCRRIFLGIETASPVIQKLIKKNLNVDSIIEKVKIIRKYGIKVEAGFMYGFPGENKEHVNVSLNLMLFGAANNLWFPEIGMLNVENGTELYDELKEQLYIDNDVDNLYFFGDNEFKYFYKMYKKHPDLFPHFYDFKNETRQRYKYLDKFMWILTSMILLGYKTSINALVSYYDMDVLKIYEDLLKFHRDEFKAIFVENLNLAAGNDRKLIESRCRLLTNFLNTFCTINNGKEVEIIAELFDLDKNVVNLRIFGKVNEVVRVTYSYNLIRIRTTGEISDKGNYTFQLKKVNSTKVKIECNN